MASLLKKMFDTMPLKGASGALSRPSTNIPAQALTMGQLKKYVKVFRTPPIYTAECKDAPAAGTPADDAPLWSWKLAGDPSLVEEVTCRVRDLNFAPFTVLEFLAWGRAPITITDEATSTGTAGSFRREVLAVVNHKQKNDDTGEVTVTPKDVTLPLTAEYHLLSFITNDGYIKADDAEPLWPLPAFHDPSFVHFFLYDVDPATGKASALRLPDDPNEPLDSDQQEIKAMLARCDELKSAPPDDVRNAFEELFQDNLWVDPSARCSPTAKVQETGVVRCPAVRILVACSLTVCRERDDFVPGRFAGIARLFPHVLVAATADLVRVEAGVTFKRPDSNVHTMHMSSNEDEMMPRIGGLLVADSNADGMTVRTPGAPVNPVWANLFSYYVIDPIRDPRVGRRLVPVVLRLDGPDPRGSGSSRSDKASTVDRDCWDIGIATIPIIGVAVPATIHNQTNEKHVHKAVRQGEFDNLHLAPRMAVSKQLKIDHVEAPDAQGFSRTIPYDPATSIVAWKLDAVVMAPFCVHDCFHMHWRWSDNTTDDPSTWGWGPANPYKVPGGVMVPQNQDLFIQLLGETEVLYVARAHDVPTDAWQPFCHHGAGYAVHAGKVLDDAKSRLPRIIATKFYSSSYDPFWMDYTWSLLYWSLRYRLRAVPGSNGNWEGAVEERFSFLDEPGALGV